MGWTNAHLFKFEAGGATWGLPDPHFGSRSLSANKTTLAELIEITSVQAINYLYGFGDGWEYKIDIGKISDPIPGEFWPRLTEIAGRCPPEDVGGFHGYEQFLEAMNDPKHPEHDDLKSWYGGDFHPNTPDTDELRREVFKLAKRWTPNNKSGN